jgi:hypothetical protein
LLPGAVVGPEHEGTLDHSTQYYPLSGGVDPVPYSAGAAPSVATLVNNRLPHDDLADLFAGDRSTFRLGVDGVEQALADEFGDEWPEIVEENYFEEEPRRLDEILAAEQEMFDRIWYDRSMSHEQQLEDAGD